MRWVWVVVREKENEELGQGCVDDEDDDDGRHYN
jgi:hypothetical protein